MRQLIEIWMSEDDRDLWKEHSSFFKEWFECKDVDVSIKFFLNPGYMAQETGSPAFIVLDVGGGIGYSGGVIQCGVANVRGLLSRFPGVPVIIFSAIGAFADEIFEYTAGEANKEQVLLKVVKGFRRDKICRFIDNLR